MAKKTKKTEEPEQEVTNTPDAEPTETEDETAKFEQELAELKDSYLRIAAEYDNFRKRTAKERESLFATAKASVITAMLPVYDNLERAAAQETADEAYKKGVEMTLAQFVQSLESIGVKAIDSGKGSPFDPAKHNAVMHMDDESLGTNVVVDTLQRGFETDGKVIRPAVVTVAN